MNAANRSSTCSKAEEKRSNCGRSAMQPAELLHERLRRLAVEDPREARKAFLQLFDSGGSALEQFLGQISSPADGRLRHLVASALRNNRDKERLAPYLIAWHEIETDEFAKRAIAAALDGVKTESAGADRAGAGGCAFDDGDRAGDGAAGTIEPRVGDRARGAGASLPAAASAGAGPGLLRALPACARGGRRLLRLSGAYPTAGSGSPSETCPARAWAPR